MPFTVRVAQSCRDYLAQHFPGDEKRIEDGIDRTLNYCSPEFRQERRQPAPLGSSRLCFEITHIVGYQGALFTLGIIVDDTEALADILDVVYMEIRE